MTVDPNEVKWAKSLLWPNETVEITVQQRRIGPGGDLLTPTTVIATDMRLIIVNKTTLGLRKDYEVIPYRQITSVRFEKGIISSTVFIRVQGYDMDKGLLKNGAEEGEIDGLNNRDARDLADYINQKTAGEAVINTNEDIDKELGAYVYCTKCGAKDTTDAKFCAKCGAKLK